MRAEKASGSEERRVLTAMVVDPVVLGRISPKWKKGEGMFASRWANIIANWCVNYFHEYGKAPGASIEPLFQSWATDAEKETVALVERFLLSLSDEYENLEKESNSDYIADLAATHFNRVALRNLVEAMQGDLDAGKVDRAHRRLVEHSILELGMGQGVDVLQDQEAMREAFEEQQEPLITFPGAQGKFFKGAFCRDSFTAIYAPEKRGKSWELQDIAWRAMQQRRKVAFFSVGDMSQNQMMRRFMIRAARHPRYKGKVWVPKDITWATPNENDETLPHIEFEQRIFEEDLSWQRAKAACDEVTEKAKTKETLLKLATYPANTINMKGIEAKLQEWEREGWVADVVIVDYFDIMAEEPNSGDDERSRTNARWKEGRAMAQRRHCALVTATQTNAASYNVDLLTRSHFSEDKRKLAHVTDLYALNQTRNEKQLGIIRKNWIARREQPYDEGHCVYVATCFKLANPSVKSCFKERQQAATPEPV
jgi:hypothetical protein